MTSEQRLTLWGLATFHVSVFVLVALFFLYRANAVEFLRTLNTLVGFALFGALWATTYNTTARALRGTDWSRVDAVDSVRRAARYGALNGLFFLGILAVGFIGGSVITVGIGGLGILFLLPIAMIFATGIGAVVGLALGLVDLVLFGLARALVPFDQGAGGASNR